MREEPGRDCLERAVGELSDEGAERRHEVLVERAVEELGLDRARAEQIYALAEEERLEPVYAFELVRCNIGVRQLESPQAPEDGAAAQQAPPAWLGQSDVELDDVSLERHLRLSFRRFRALIEARGDVVAAARAYMGEPDVGPLRLR